MRKRSEFLYVRDGVRAPRPNVLVQARRRAADPAFTPDLVRVGFTATKKIGNAVVRNRAKRRLRAAARETLPLLGAPGVDYVFIARAGTAAAPWAGLLDDVGSALLRLRAVLAQGRAATD